MTAPAMRQETAREHIRNANQMATAALELVKLGERLELVDQVQLYQGILRRLHLADAAIAEGRV